MDFNYVFVIPFVEQKRFSISDVEQKLEEAQELVSIDDDIYHASN